MNSVSFRPLCACARHVRKFSHFVLLSLFIGVVAAISSTAPIFADELTPLPDQPTLAASLSGYVFYDKNHNDWIDALDIGVGGVKLVLYATTDLNTPVATTFTDNTGKYSFPELDPDTYALFNTTPNGNWLPLPGKINGTYAGTEIVDIANVEIGNIVLKGLDKGELFNFAGGLYPIQLISKRMLTASGGEKITTVPEPNTAVMLIFAAIGLGAGVAGHRYFRK